MAVFVIFFLISFFLTYSLYSWAARKQEDSMIEQSSVQMVTGVRNNLDEMVLNVNDDFNMLLKGGTLDVVIVDMFALAGVAGCKSPERRNGVEKGKYGKR